MQWRRPNKGIQALIVLVAFSAALAGHCDPAPDPGARQRLADAGPSGSPDMPLQSLTTSASPSPSTWTQRLETEAALANPTAPATQTRLSIQFGLPAAPHDRQAAYSAPQPDEIQDIETAEVAPLSAAWVEPGSSDVQAPPAIDIAQDGQLLLLDMTVNGTHRGPALMMMDAKGKLYAQADTLSQWGMRDPFPPPVEVTSRQFHGFGALPGVRATVETQTMTGSVLIPPQYMADTQRSLSWQSGIAPTSDNGAFVDYGLAYTDDPGLAARQLSGFLNPTVFTTRGNLSAGLLYRNLDAQLGAQTDELVRLDTTWTTDFPDRLVSLRVGDALTPQSSWSRMLRFGGIQWATNFATQPTLITFPQPSISGSAAVPTAMDIFVNGSLRASQDLPDGTFRIEDIPVVTGAGQIQVVTRDVMGREQLVVQDFYASQTLLRPGLWDYAVSIGALRQNYSLQSNDYSDMMVSAMLRRGLSSDFTLEGRFDASSAIQVVSGSAAYSMTRLGVFSTSLAISNEDNTGVLWQLGHQYQGRKVRFDLRFQGASEHFAQPGVDLPNAFPRLQSLVSAGTGLGELGTFGMSVVDERFHDPSLDRRIVTLNYSRPLPYSVSLSVNGSYIQQEGNELQASLLLMKYFGGRRSASTTMQHAGKSSSLRAEYRNDVPVGPGFGYRAAAFTGDNDSLEAGTTLHTDHARLQAEVRSRDGDTGWRAQLDGSVAWLGGDWYASREIRDGFAVVDTGGFEGVHVYLENRDMGVTDSSGRLMIPGLLPYQANRISMNSRDLPLSARVGETRQEVAPYYRTGVMVEFDAEETRSALLRVTWPDGTPVPEGSEAQIVGRSEVYPVGRNGRLYLQDLYGETRVLVRNHVWQCHLDLPNISRRTAEVIQKLGDFVCVNEMN
jgi:outer membrane usher protein